MGRPSEYSQEIGTEICERLASGNSLRNICKASDMPSDRAVYRWLASNEAFRQQYAHAREIQADTLADEILDISNTTVLGVKTKTTADGVETTEGDMIEHRRLQVDARKWLASKMAPKKYGDRMDHNVVVAPIAVNINLDSD